MKEKDWVSECRNLKVGNKRGSRRGRKTWRECVDEDMKTFGLSKEIDLYGEAIFMETVQPVQARNKGR